MLSYFLNCDFICAHISWRDSAWRLLESWDPFCFWIFTGSCTCQDLVNLPCRLRTCQMCSEKESFFVWFTGIDRGTFHSFRMWFWSTQWCLILCSHSVILFTGKQCCRTGVYVVCYGGSFCIRRGRSLLPSEWGQWSSRNCRQFWFFQTLFGCCTFRKGLGSYILWSKIKWKSL